MKINLMNQGKKKKFTTSDEDDVPPGSQWDGDNYSCAYDALFTILFNIWVSNPKKWKKIFKDSNEYLSTLHDGFQKYLTGVSTLEVASDDVRTLLNHNDPVRFHQDMMGAVLLHWPQKCSILY
jgi:hypothetical protein